MKRRQNKMLTQALVILSFFFMMSCISTNHWLPQEAQAPIEVFNASHKLVKAFQTDSLGNKNGYYKEYFENGGLKYFFHYDNGKLNGLQTLFYPNGMIKSISLYRNFNLDSTQTWFHENGSVKAKYPWRDGKLWGNQKEFDSVGKIQTLSFFAGCSSCLVSRIYFDRLGRIKNRTGGLMAVVADKEKVKKGDSCQLLFYPILPPDFDGKVYILDKTKGSVSVISKRIQYVDEEPYVLYSKVFCDNSDRVGAIVELDNKTLNHRMSDTVFAKVSVY